MHCARMWTEPYALQALELSGRRPYSPPGGSDDVLEKDDCSSICESSCQSLAHYLPPALLVFRALVWVARCLRTADHLAQVAVMQLH